MANDDPAAKQYAEWTGRACRADGIRYEIRTIDDPIHVEQALQQANDDPKVHGIIVYYPIFGQEKESYSGTSQDDYIRDTVSFQCDVEGLCHLYRSNLYRNVRYLDAPHNHIKCILPCTALSVVKILEACPNVYQHHRPANMPTNQPQKTLISSSSSSSSIGGLTLKSDTYVTIINRSEIVGRPLAAMLANDGATVYSIDLHSIYKFVNGTLQKCNDTVEDCVRKVRFYFHSLGKKRDEINRLSQSDTWNLYLLLILNLEQIVIDCHYWCACEIVSITNRVDTTQYGCCECCVVQECR